MSSTAYNTNSSAWELQVQANKAQTSGKAVVDDRDIVTDGPGSANDSISVSASASHSAVDDVSVGHQGGSKSSQPSASEEFCETPISPYYSLF